MTIRSLYRGDCLDILENDIPPESVDLVYLDPPFNSKSTYNLPFKEIKDTHDTKAVEAFRDTWIWKDTPDDFGWSDNDRLEALRDDIRLRNLSFLVDFARQQDTPSNSMGSYILSMIYRLQAIHRILKSTGSVYLHCDPTANYFLRMAMECIFGRNNFKNEIVWHYQTGGVGHKHYGRKHDLLLFYSKSDDCQFYPERIKMPRTEKSLQRAQNPRGARIDSGDTKKLPMDVWIDIQALNPMSIERLGYPTQKPLQLLERIVKASSNPDDIVLDPFCGCGTAVHASESLGRQWIGVDISRFSVGLIAERVLTNFRGVLFPSDIQIQGQPETIHDARQLAHQDAFEFQKWVCGKIGANGMAQRRGADGGIDGIIELVAVERGKVKPKTAIVQVKGGRVTPDSVRALGEVVRRSESVSGIMVCFEDRMRTVENQKGDAYWSDDSGTYPVIQGLSIESLLDGKRPYLPPTYGLRRGGRISA